MHSRAPCIGEGPTQRVWGKLVYNHAASLGEVPTPLGRASIRGQKQVIIIIFLASGQLSLLFSIYYALFLLY